MSHKSERMSDDKILLLLCFILHEALEQKRGSIHEVIPYYRRLVDDFNQNFKYLSCKLND